MQITVRQAARVLGVSPRRVRQFIDEGRLEGHALTPRLTLLDQDQVQALARVPRPAGRPQRVAS